VRGPLTVVADGADSGNGVFRYGSAGFPTESYNAANYWVDPVFTTTAPPDERPPALASVTPAAGSASVATAVRPSATFDEPVSPATVSMSVRDAGGATVAGTTAYDATSRTATLTPAAPLAAGTAFTVTVSARDTAGNAMTPYSWSFRTAAAPAPPGSCPCSIWDETATPATVEVDDPQAIELGVKFTADRDGEIRGIRFYKAAGNTGAHTGTLWDAAADDAVADGKAVELGVKFRAAADGFVTGVRFYKGSANTGTHVGNLWSADGRLLARATFDSETASGWQQVSFAAPVAVRAGTTYVASYFAPYGRYAADSGLFGQGGVSRGLLTALGDGVDGGNGVYAYARTTAFPTASYRGANYWVDVVFTTDAAPDTIAPSVTATTPAAGAGSVAPTASLGATFDEPVRADSVRMTLAAPTGPVSGTVAYDAATRTATFTPGARLADATTYTATVDAAVDAAGNPMAAPVRWTFTTSAPPPAAGDCPCSLWDETAVPDVTSADDASAVELGVRFVADADGLVKGIRFYKGITNTGTHTGTLWDAQGRPLARVTFTDESTTGWQTALFAAPVAVTAGATYTASYSAPNGGYAYSRDYFARAWDNGALHAPAHTDAAPNGVYALDPGTAPVLGRGTNYWVDVVFERLPTG
jgi:hypothetical protein